MKKLLVSLFALIVASPASTALACTEDGRHGIFPKNDLYIPVSAFGKYAVDETDFNAIIARAEKLYAPIFAAQGRTYKIIANWNDGTVNAYADRSGSVSQIHMFGGLARHPKTTADAFALVVCHETGHHIGGAPKTRGIWGANAWAANEGQSDYFATLKCAREMWKDDDNAAIIAKIDVPALVTEKCQKAFDGANAIAICKRSALAGKSLGDTLADLNKAAAPEFDRPDASVVKKMFSDHPTAQCRLDTYFAGAVCPRSTTEGVSETDPTVGVCAQEKGETLGIRPLCWYLPFDPNAPKRSSTWPSSRLSRR